jgi:flagellin
MVINTNITAQNSARLLAESSQRLSKSLTRLSSGSRLNSPEDDAAGMAVSMRLDAQISRLRAVDNNVNNAISFAQTEDGYLQKVQAALTRMSELSVLALDTTKTTTDLSLYDKEFATLAAYISDISTKDYNAVSLFSGVARNVTTDAEATTYSMTGVSLNGLAAYTSLNSISVTTTTAANTALTAVKNALVQLASDRAQVGANIARLTGVSSTLGVLNENLSAANSRIKDVDMAEESTEFARYNILVQAGTAMLVQANAASQAALRLLSY